MDNHIGARKPGARRSAGLYGILQRILSPTPFFLNTSFRIFFGPFLYQMCIAFQCKGGIYGMWLMLNCRRWVGDLIACYIYMCSTFKQLQNLSMQWEILLPVYSQCMFVCPYFSYQNLKRKTWIRDDISQTATAQSNSAWPQLVPVIICRSTPVTSQACLTGQDTSQCEQAQMNKVCIFILTWTIIP